MSTFISLFTGGGGADLGAMAAGLAPVAGLEYSLEIAAVGCANIGDHVRWGAVQDADYSTFPAAFWLHASPPCTTASQANTNGGETALDLAMAQGVCRAIQAIKPRRFSLENVWGYRTYASFAAILACLHSEGYAVNFWHLNSADYGVPQTRKRLILVASLDHTPRRPAPTHQDPRQIVDGQMSMTPQLPAWRGWYGAIADIAHALPDSEFAPWQLKRLPAALRETLLVSDFDGTIRCSGEPSTTIRAKGDQGGALPRALLVGGGNTNTTVIDSTYRDGIGPSYTVTAASNQDRAFICDGQANENGATITTRHGEDPIFTVAASADKRPARAFIGRVVSATPRALARWQSVPDSYALPGRANLACKIIGNMWPPDFARAVIAANIGRAA